LRFSEHSKKGSVLVVCSIQFGSKGPLLPVSK
jgi:hypothetical protein